MEYAEKIKKVFSTNLKYYMKKNNVTPKEISEYTNFSKQSVSNWINGKLMPRMGVVEKLSLYFKIAKSDLLEEKALINNLEHKTNISLLPNDNTMKYEKHRLIECGLYEKFRSNRVGYETWEKDYLKSIILVKKDLELFSNKLIINKVPLLDLDLYWNNSIEEMLSNLEYIESHITNLSFYLELMYKEIGNDEYNKTLNNSEKKYYLESNYPTYNFDNKTNDEIDLLYDVFTSNEKI